MRWKEKSKRIPNGGERRILRKFLILPHCIDGEYRWLERVMILQEYVATYRDYCGCYRGNKWEDIEFLTEDEVLRRHKELEVKL